MANATNDLLQLQSFPLMAAALQSRIDRIMRRWEEGVRELLPNADELTLTQLRDHLPIILNELCVALDCNGPTDCQELLDSTRKHGTGRFHQNYRVGELILEYRLLRRIVAEEVSDALSDQMNLRQMMVLDMGIDTSMQESVVAFADHQKAQLQSATESQAKYLSFLSHDLRNNLNGITLTLQLLSRRLAAAPEFAEEAEDVEAVQRSVLETVTGMDRLLQAERLRRRAVEPKIAPVNLHALIADAVRQVTQRAQEKGLALQWDVDPNLNFRSDRELISLVLQNLIGNAIKYSQKGSVRIHASAERAATGSAAGAAAEEICISIADDGPGIAPEHQARLFEAFSRGETHGQSGLGLGLAIAFDAARLLGGRLTVSSQLGRGSTFQLSLPA